MEHKEHHEHESKNTFPPTVAIALAVVAFFGVLWLSPQGRTMMTRKNIVLPFGERAVDAETVIPSKGAEIPVRWGDLGKKLTESGAIDKDAFEELYASRGGLSESERALLTGEDNGNIVIPPENSGTVLNLFWALGLANKNDILESGPMATFDGETPASRKAMLEKAANFASTGGWTLAKGDPMNHYSAHQLMTLTPAEQQAVERVAKGIYRPCCGNSTHFPDCNHGMAMLGLLELMASEGASEEEMYRTALAVNSYWFPDTYLTIAQFMRTKGVEWKDADPKEVLGYDFSSAAGYKKILSEVTPPASRSGGGCGV